jgi:hypothetical protein
MENFFLKIKDIVFRLKLDAETASKMLERVPSLNNIYKSSYNIDVICMKVERINFTDERFLNQQEPDIDDTCYYREIFDLGIFKYLRKEKTLQIVYLDTDKYPFNSFEVVVDTILQFIYLIMLEFEIVPLHAAVLAYKNRAVLLFGNSGSGKTTLELSLLHSGFLFFSDDIAFLDEKTRIYNSGERIIACSKNSEEIIHQCFDTTFLDMKKKNSVNKQIINIDSTMVSEHSDLMPYMIIFPMPGIDKEPLKKIETKSAFIELIKLSISTQFPAIQKQLYMKRLKQLSENTQAFQYFWTSNKCNLKEICRNIREICEQGEESL